MHGMVKTTLAEGGLDWLLGVASRSLVDVHAAAAGSESLHFF